MLSSVRIPMSPFHAMSTHFNAYSAAVWKVHYVHLHHSTKARRLVKWVGAGSPVGEEQAESDGLEDTGNGADGNGIKWSLLSDKLGDELDVY